MVLLSFTNVLLGLRAFVKSVPVAWLTGPVHYAPNLALEQEPSPPYASAAELNQPTFPPHLSLIRGSSSSA
jgi:hypothetical protein